MGFDVNLNKIQCLCNTRTQEALVLEGASKNIQTSNKHQSASELKDVIRKVREVVSATSPVIIGSGKYDLDDILAFLREKKDRLISERSAVVDITSDSGLESELKALSKEIEKMQPLANRFKKTEGG